jgi:single-strand DNA-binding protein
MGYSKATIIGYLTRDPESRSTKAGKTVVSFTVAVNSAYGKGDERKEEVSFFDVTTFGFTAEACAKYLKKGAPVFVEGELKQRTWEDKEGQKKSKIVIEVGMKGEVKFLPRGEAKAADAGREPGEEDIPY